MNNSCILAALSHDCYIKHTCNGRKKYIIPILPTDQGSADLATGMGVCGHYHSQLDPVIQELPGMGGFQGRSLGDP